MLTDTRNWLANTPGAEASHAWQSFGWGFWNPGWEKIEKGGNFQKWDTVSLSDSCWRVSDTSVGLSDSLYHERKDAHAKSKKRAAQEVVNSLLKDYSILEQQFRSDNSKHKYFFCAVLVLVQLNLMENPLFESNYHLVNPYLPQVPEDFEPPKPSKHSVQEEDGVSEAEKSSASYASSEGQDPAESIQQLFRHLNTNNSSSEEQEEGSNSSSSSVCRY